MSRLRFAVVAFVLVAPVMAFGNKPVQIPNKKGMTLDAARAVLTAAVAEVKKLNTTGVIAVVDEGGHLVCLERADGTFAAGANISVGKARTAALFKKPTKVFEDIIKNGRTPMVALEDFTPLQGGVPILYEGQVIGAIGVSGAASAQQDEDIANAGANALGPMSESGSGAASLPILFFDKDQVAQAFSKGLPLFDGDPQRNYKIHASRRDKPGMAEVHLSETDIIYVQEGSATFVTGGTVVDASPTAQDEIRGPAIHEGKTSTLAKGDVIVVPQGTPHWFKEVSNPFVYYVVKVAF